MPRFYLHQQTGQSRIEDLEGSDLPDLAAARTEVILAGRQLVAQAILRDGAPLIVGFDIADENGCSLLVLPLRELMPSWLSNLLL
jgi:hypothetical protein